MDYEYGIKAKDSDDAYRIFKTKEEAQGWLDSWEITGGIPDTLEFVRRPTGPWEAVDDTPVEVTAKKNRPVKRTPDVVWAIPQGRRLGW